MSWSQIETNPNSIFVAIPSYRDDECPITINKAFEDAENPQNVYIGLVDQYVEG